MKSVRASATATLFLSLATLLSWTNPGQVEAQIRTPEVVCSQQIGASGRRYIEQVLAARIRCEARAIKGIIDPTTNCRTGDGDAKMQQALRTAESKLSHSLPARCSGVELTDLDFPGVCTDTTPPTFDTLDLLNCIVGETDNIVAGLMAVYYPPIDDFFRGFKSVCLRGVPIDAYRMFRGDVRARAACTYGKAVHTVPNGTDCRNDIPSWGPGTGDDLTDLHLRRAYVQFLGGVPVECANFPIDDLNYQEVCPDGTGGLFSMIDLKQCIFDRSRPQVQDVMNLLFPTDPICGNARVEIGEQCDNGPANSNTVVDACRLNCSDARCGDGVADTGEVCDDGNTLETDDCTSECKAGVCGDGTLQGAEECDDGATLNSDSTPDACRTDCTTPSCGDGVTDPNTGDEECDDSNNASNDLCSATCKVEFCGDGIKQTSEQCDTTATACTGAGASCSGGCECQLPCPGSGELVLHSAYGEECSNNADCPVGTCDTGASGRCKTITKLDSGWTGLAHNADINNKVVTRGFLECDSATAPCGECEVVGLDPSNRNCRCRNDNQAICDQPFEADADDCGGSVCDCYFGAPFPLSSGGTPACVVNRFFEDITGTADVDLGAGAITANLRTQVFLGMSTTSPCAVCGGKCAENPSQFCVFDEDCASGGCNTDPVSDDGIRGGFCVDGVDAGTACDVNGINTSFPARPDLPGGGGYSIDCFPSGTNVSGSGLIIKLTQTTGTTSMDFNVPCGQGNALCPCKVCTTDNFFACNSDAECSDQSGTCSVSNKFNCVTNGDCQGVNGGTCLMPSGRCQNATTVTCQTNEQCASINVGQCNPSTCTANGSGGFPAPNQCVGRLCSDLGDNQGECTTGPDSTYCDAVVKPNGEGILSCNTNEDCLPESVGVDAGNCTVKVRRQCFLDPIVSEGHADPSEPVGAAVFCIPPTSSDAINPVAGLVGPGRVVNQAKSRTFCESDPSRQYQPGAGGCQD